MERTKREQEIIDGGTLRESTSDDFLTMPSLSMPGTEMPVGSGIQCEACHGTGQAASVEEGAHTNTGVQVMTKLEPQEGAAQGLGQSQVCGQCHGSYPNYRTSPGTALAGTSPW